MTAAAWSVVLLALVAANLPFCNDRLLLVGRRLAPKPLGWRLAELFVLGVLTLLAGTAIEARLGQRHSQGWEFYAAFAFLFLTLAFPGFVWRCLRRWR